MTFEQRATEIATHLKEEGQYRPDMYVRMTGAGIIFALLAVVKAIERSGSK